MLEFISVMENLSMLRLTVKKYVLSTFPLRFSLKDSSAGKIIFN